MTDAHGAGPRVLIIGLQGLGNLILSSPAWLALEEQLRARVSVLVPDQGAESLLSAVPGRREVIVAAGRGRAQLALRLAARRFQAVIVAYPGGPRSAGLAWATGAPIRLGHVGRKGWVARLLLNEALEPTPGRHDVAHNIDLAARAIRLLSGREAQQAPPPVVAPPAKDVEFADRWLDDHELGRRRLLGIAPGSGRRQHFKRWPLGRFVEVVRQLGEGDGNLGVLWFLGPDEEDLAQDLRAAGLAPRLGTLVSGLDILVVLALLGRCRALLSNDNGLMHMAALQEVPVVALFGPTDESRTRPYAKQGTVLTASVACRPCYSTNVVGFRCVNPDPFVCLAAIGSGDVLRVLETLLKEPS